MPVQNLDCGSPFPSSGRADVGLTTKGFGDYYDSNALDEFDPQLGPAIDFPVCSPMLCRGIL
jgi:hypothetical protein